MSFKTCAFSENIRPVRVLVALHWLMRKSDLYKNSNIDIDEEWIRTVNQSSNEELQEFISDSTTETSMSTHSHGNNKNEGQSQSEELYDSDAEDIQQENVGNIDEKTYMILMLKIFNGKMLVTLIHF